LLRRQRARYRQDRAAAKALVGIGLASNPQAAAGVDATELASWTAVTRVLLNLHETTTRN